jgi:hypothetical protein
MKRKKKSSKKPSAAPPVPGVARLAWLLFMQPFVLKSLFQAWGYDRDPTWGSVILRRTGGDQNAEKLFRRFKFLLLGGIAILGLVIVQVFLSVGIPIPPLTPRRIGIVLGLVYGCGLGLLFSLYLGIARGAALGFAGTIANSLFYVSLFGPAYGVVTGIALGIFAGSSLGILLGAIGALSSRSSINPAYGLIGGLAFGILGSIVTGILGGLLGLVFGAKVGLAICLSTGLSFLLSLLHLFSFPAEVLVMAVLSVGARFLDFGFSRLSRFLPFLYHDLIYFPLPGLRPYLVKVGVERPELAQRLLSEALGSIAQKRAARLALVELRARSLESAARERLYARVAELDLAFLPAPKAADLLGPSLALDSIVAAARDLQVARRSTSHFHRRRALERAEKILDSAQFQILEQPEPNVQEQRFLAVLRSWRDVVQAESTEFAHLERKLPQVPLPFVAGPALDLPEQGLFKGRRDFIRLIEQDLIGGRQAALVVVGQRRIGKSSLLHMLPVHLGNDTTVVLLNIQALSGSPHRAAPARWVAEAVVATLPQCSPPPETSSWEQVLGWLRQVEALLEHENSRLLIAVDEVDKLEEGVRQGRSGKYFLDFVSTASDELHRVRFLLATALSLHRLGRHWCDRLGNALLRQLGVLDEAGARSLVCEPIPGFPEIYPPGGVERILAATGRHPYLLQLVCDRLCRRLAEEGRLQAITKDLEAALDHAFNETPLFAELWRQRTETECELLRQLARGRSPDCLDPEVAQTLLREQYLVGQGDDYAITLPLFAEWIAENG